MRVFLCSLILAGGLTAAPINRTQTVLEIKAALASMKDEPAAQDPIKDPRDLGSIDAAQLRLDVAHEHTVQEQAMNRLAQAVILRYGGSTSLSWAAAYALTSAVAGKKMTEINLLKAAESVLWALDAADALERCNQSSDAMWKNPAFQRRLLQLYQDLMTLGVSDDNARIVCGNLARGVEFSLGPAAILRPIPPPEQSCR